MEELLSKITVDSDVIVGKIRHKRNRCTSYLIVELVDNGMTTEEY